MEHNALPSPLCYNAITSAMINARERFSETAAIYNSSRPSYPHRLVTWILNCSDPHTGAVFADVGCGTGISTRLFLKKPVHVVGIDPNRDMLRMARAVSRGAIFVEGDASKTHLAAQSVDVIVSGQALHWFNLTPTLTEFRRILTPRGWCFAFWNIRSGSLAMNDYDNLLHDASRDYRSTPRPASAIAAIKRSPRTTNIMEQAFSNFQILDQEQLKLRALSSSYVMHGVSDKKKFLDELGCFFNLHQQNGHITFRYQTIAIGWQFGKKSL